MKITLAKVLEGLSHDTLSFMSDSNQASGSIIGDQIPKVINRVNSVLRRLAVKFTLQEKTIKVMISKDQRYYPLVKGASYIVEDPAEPYLDDVARILSIETSNGRSHDLSDLAAHDSILLRDEGRAFAIDEYVPTGLANVIYKANTPQFEVDAENQDQLIVIPESLLNALYLGVAAITYQGIGGPENIALSRDMWGQYENECTNAKLNSTVEVDQFEEANKFEDRGWR